MKRRYRTVAVVVGPDGGVTIELDGRPMATPGRRPFHVPARALAEASAAEWLAQGDVVKPDTMPLTQIAATAIDRVGAQRAELIPAVAAYGATDMLCYRAEEPADLVERQRRLWQPLLDWAARALDAPLRVTSGILPIDQPADALAALGRVVAAYDDFALAALSCATAASGSLVVGLALMRGEIDAAGAFDAAELDASFQIERWGADEEATHRRAALRQELESAARFVGLLYGSQP